MKKSKRNLLIIIISSVIVILLIIIVIFAFKHKDNMFDKDATNGYNILDEVIEIPGTNIISNDSLNEEKCLDDICVSNVKIYAVDNTGRVECVVKNNTANVKSGYLKLTASGQTVLIAYKELGPGESVNAIAGYDGKSISSADSYTIENLTKKEQKAIKK